METEEPTPGVGVALYHNAMFIFYCKTIPYGDTCADIPYVEWSFRSYTLTS